jgi:acyl-CoA thioester hydrolase
MPVPAPAPFFFSHIIRVQPSDIDELNHANNVQYVRWVQDTAGAHWLAAFPSREREKYIWVVQEHRIKYLRPALEGEELRCSTWLGDVRGALSQRFTRIERISDNVLLCEAQTWWVLLDPGTGRPRRIESHVIQRLKEPLS